MMEMIFDTHAHYDDEAFDEDRSELLGSLKDRNICGVTCQGTTLQSSRFCLSLAEQFDGVFAAVGIHPEEVTETSLAELPEIMRLAAHPKVVAIGEIGLDYHWDTPRDLQKRVFTAQLQMAAQLNMPVNIHDREAHGDMLELLEKYRPKGILHCFSGSPEMARQIVRMGMYIGVGGVITFKNARKLVETVEQTPLEQIVLETDCPYLAPVPFRGKRNESSLIRYAAEKIAEIKGMTSGEILSAATKNAQRVYGIPDTALV